jgi:hypothetical protein
VGGPRDAAAAGCGCGFGGGRAGAAYDHVMGNPVVHFEIYGFDQVRL